MFYKYLSSEIALLTLKKMVLKFSSPIEFNDPYESQVYIQDFSVKEYRSKCWNTDKKISTLFYRLRDQGIVSNRNQFNEIFYNDYELEKVMISDKIRLIQPWINNFPRKIGTTFRTCCLTQDPENLLMWSHYSDSHKGLVLGFEFDDNVNKRIHNVDYSKEKYELGIECCYGTKFPQEFMNSVLLRKSDIWDYEDEVRIIMLKKELKNMSDDMFGLEFNNINIKRIILGSKVDISILHEINGLIEDQYNHIKPEIALLQQNEYKIRIDDLNKSINQYIQEREKNDQFYEEYIVANN